MTSAIRANRRSALWAAAALALCSCSLAFNLDALQGAADTVAGDAAATTDDGPASGSLPETDPFEDVSQGAAEVADPNQAADDGVQTSDASLGSESASPEEDGAAPADRSVIEAAIARDAAVETASTQDSGGAGFDAGSWCAANMAENTVYCNDFDEPASTVKGTWDSVFSSSPDCASLDSPVDAPSAPHTLLLSTPLVASGATYQEQFVKYPANVNVETLQFSLKVAGFDPNAKDVSLVWLGYRSAAWSVTLDLAGTGAHLFESVKQANGTFQGISHPVAQPPLGVWTTIVLTVDSAGNKMSLSYDGNPVAITNSTIMNSPSPSAAFSTIVGANYLQGPAQPMKISYDNILISVN